MHGSIFTVESTIIAYFKGFSLGITSNNFILMIELCRPICCLNTWVNLRKRFLLAMLNSKQYFQVPLGVLLHNENRGEDMIKILTHIYQYVPVVEYETELDIPNSTNKKIVHNVVPHPILFGGDQLTAARVRGAQDAKCNSTSSDKRFDGIVPVIEDWHTKVVILEVCQFCTQVCTSIYVVCHSGFINV